MNKMKNLLLFSIVLFISSCTNMNDNIREYLDRGEINYIGKVDSAATFSGKERILFKWKLNDDPRIERCMIYWNNNRDSISIPVSPSKLDAKGYLSETLNIPEGDYIFNMRHVGSGGFRSVREEVTGRSYGARYESTLLNRGLRSATYRGSGGVKLEWTVAADSEVGVLISYTDLNGVKRSKTVEVSEMITVIPDLMGKFTYKTMHKPVPSAIDVFYAPESEVTPVNPSPILLDKSKFKRQTLPGDNTTEFSSSFGFAKMWDEIYNDPGYIQANDSGTPYNYFTIDLGVEAILTRYSLWQRYSLEFIHCNPKKWKVYGTSVLSSSTDAQYWNEGFKDDWFLLADCDLVIPSGETTPTEEDLKYARAGFTFTIPANAPPVRYVRFHVIETWNGQTNTEVQEVSFWGIVE